MVVKFPLTFFTTTGFFCKAQNLKSLRGLPPRDCLDHSGTRNSHGPKQGDLRRPLQETRLSWLRTEEDGERVGLRGHPGAVTRWPWSEKRKGSRALECLRRK